MATLNLSNATKSYGDVDVIKGIDLDIADGEFVVFVGPSGCGKSTLLRMIAGLEDITAGELKIDGERCNERAPKDRGIAMVFQSYALYPHKSVYENMAFGLRLAKRPKDEIDAKIREAAGILQMEHLLERRPSQLSGGQRQRVAIGRAIVRNPKVFLFDEPLSNLDAALRVSMRREIARLHGELDATMIYVTHDQVEAMTLADRIVVLDGGVVQQVGRPMELYNRPQNVFVAGFIGSPKMNFFQGEITGTQADSITVTTPATAAVAVPVTSNATPETGRAVTMGIRPEHLSVADDGTAPGFTGTIVLVERLGDESLLEIALSDGTEVIAKVAGGGSEAAGDTIRLTFDPAHLHLFDADGERIG
ncbi:ABC transporter ATP-binding protein [Cucumibacter marinus]|uniref:ABC transporter ATP-binding protein n=1 Tax=Cucumibacter marinus TaxID=1121252 RepID=UPI0003FB2DEC|nr:sn-glycerol-3-phosphate ABC transporter ATP-binding protein UgpC [Cucumibacter marinus]